MEITATIKRVLTKKVFETENGKFTSQPLVLETTEERQLTNGNVFTLDHSFIAELIGQKAEDFSLGVGTTVNVGLHFVARAGKGYPDRYFQSIKITYISVRQ